MILLNQAIKNESTLASDNPPHINFFL